MTIVTQVTQQEGATLEENAFQGTNHGLVFAVPKVISGKIDQTNTNECSSVL